MNKIYLASGSPRRWELLQQLGLELVKIGSEVDETPLPNEQAKDYCLRIALEKNQAAQAVRSSQNFANKLDDSLICPSGRQQSRRSKNSAFCANLPILTADTTVSIDGSILGKPSDKADAAAMLERLSGKTHQVFTAVCVSYNGTQFSTVQTSEVTFKALSADEIRAYVESGEPFDKAGAYGIQGVGGIFISHLSGSFTGVMGLPLYETAELLRQCGVQILAKE